MQLEYPLVQPHRILLVLAIVAGSSLFWLLSVSQASYQRTQTASATIWYVKADAQGGNDGGSWENAFTDLQDALAAVHSGQEIWVAAGLYKPTGNETDREATFQLLDGVAIYGGFAGDESVREERDWQNSITVLSGDIDDNDITDSHGVVTDTVNIVGGNSYHVVTGNGVTNTAVLDGFFITAGQANGSFTTPCGRYCGGGMYNVVGNPTLANSSFVGNFAVDEGGGMYNFDSNATMHNVSFDNNTSGLHGGGMHNQYSNPTLTNVAFNGNRSFAIMISRGGGMYNFYSNPILVNVSFSNNGAWTGGGLYNNSSDPPLTNVSFNGNLNSGLYNFYSNPILTNVSFSGNTGSGIYNIGSNPILTNVTFSGNRNSSNGGGMFNSSSNPIIRNSIFWGNEDSSGMGTAASAIFNSNSTPTVSYSLIQGSNGSGDDWNEELGIDLGNNLDADPLFVAPPDPANAPTAEGNLRLQPGSPAIYAGNNEYVVGIETDLDGNPRIVGPYVDLGPYEFHEQITYTITTHLFGEGNIELEPDRADYLYGDVVTVTGIAAPGWTFAGWDGDLSGQANPTELIIDDHKEITATFSRNVYSLTVHIEGEGSVELEPGQSDYFYGDVVTVTAIGAPGWTFAGWDGDLSGDSNPTGLLMDGDKVVTVIFIQDSYSVYLPLLASK